jgi:hypothetical protein
MSANAAWPVSENSNQKSKELVRAWVAANNYCDDDTHAITAACALALDRGVAPGTALQRLQRAEDAAQTRHALGLSAQ